jgi:hypothetical protein
MARSAYVGAGSAVCLPALHAVSATAWKHSPGQPRRRGWSATPQRDRFRRCVGQKLTSAMATEGSSAADPFGFSSGDRFCPRPNSGAGQAGDCVAHDSERHASVLETAPVRPKQQPASGPKGDPVCNRSRGGAALWADPLSAGRGRPAERRRVGPRARSTRPRCDRRPSPIPPRGDGQPR